MPPAAPKFTKTAVVNGLFEQVSLDQFTNKGQWVVLVFVPLAFTVVCPTEIVSIDASLGKFQNRNAQVLVASTDSEFTLLAWNNTPRNNGGLGKVSIPLLADTNHSLSKQYGVLIPEEGIARSGTFIINPEGQIVYKSINDTPVGRSLDEILRVIDAFQLVREYPEQFQ